MTVAGAPCVRPHPQFEVTVSPNPQAISPSKTDRVHGVGFRYSVRIGFHEYERHIRQEVMVDFEAETDWRAAAAADDEHVGLVDYFEVNRAIQTLADSREWRLVEALAERIAFTICDRFPVSAVRVKVTKAPFDMPNVGAVAVECWRRREDFDGIDLA